LVVVVVLIFGGRFRCNQSFAGATELGPERNVKRASVANGSGWGRVGMKYGEWVLVEEEEERAREKTVL
jgi:hypothetical protein